MKVNDYGQYLYIDIGEDISSSLSQSVMLLPPTGDAIEITTHIAIGSSDITVGEYTFLANQYLIYTVQPEVITKSGVWQKKGVVKQSSTVEVSSRYVRFTVTD